MSKIHVLMKKEDLAGGRLSGKVVVVFDVLFATTSIVTALAHGAESVIPVPDAAVATQLGAGLAPDSYILAGELFANEIPGFAAATPLELLKEGVEGKTVIYSTTNGTVALHAAQSAADVYAASLVNVAATAEHIRRYHPNQSVLIVCSGSANRFNLEDFLGAGHLVARLLSLGAYALSDAAAAALLVQQSADVRDCLNDSGVGRMMRSAGLAHNVDFAARCNIFDLVARLEQGNVRAVCDSGGR